ncbi:hypothetical protein FKK36_25960, partial [Klebsiella pneumoniae]|nr:hypothetical protein [Klebsiella pneumoniae]MBK3094414.1 hypothetical protein [Klebsiella pneumoniae]
IGPDPRNFNQRVSLGRNDLLIRTFPKLEQENADKIAENLRFLFPEIISIIEQASSSIDIGEFH